MLCLPLIAVYMGWLSHNLWKDEFHLYLYNSQWKLNYGSLILRNTDMWITIASIEIKLKLNYNDNYVKLNNDKINYYACVGSLLLWHSKYTCTMNCACILTVFKQEGPTQSTFICSTLLCYIYNQKYSKQREYSTHYLYYHIK